MKDRTNILTGVKPTGIPHLGNILGAIKPCIELTDRGKLYMFVADLHAFTNRDVADIYNNTKAVASTYLAFGLDTYKNVLYKQSDVPQVTELYYYLNCFATFPKMKRMHSYKAHEDNEQDLNVGLFTYPTLMSADILLYDADYVPVGKDQKQHLELTRFLAKRFNNEFGNILKLPNPIFNDETNIILGTDGEKMSKSYGNTINIFEEENKLKKVIGRIKTDSKGETEPKDYDTCIIYHLVSKIGNDKVTENLKQNYINGTISYKGAKDTLYELIMNTYKEQREIYNIYMESDELVDRCFKSGAEEMNDKANSKLKEIRKAIGYER